MAKFDNLSIEDLREFIGLLTGDTYFPEQLLDFDAITLADAIRYLQENNSTKNSYTPVNANNIYKVSAANKTDMQRYVQCYNLLMTKLSAMMNIMIL